MEKILKPMSGYLALIISLALLVAGGFLFVNGLSDENGTFFGIIEHDNIFDDLPVYVESFH